MSQTKPNSRSEVEVVSSALVLANFYKDDPAGIDKSDFQRGSEVVGIYSDENFKASFKNFGKMKVEALKLAIEDLSRGATTLRTSTIGLTYVNNKMQVYIMPFGNTPAGNVVFSISLKNAKAFMQWRKGDGNEIPQEKINSAIYRLTVLISECL